MNNLSDLGHIDQEAYARNTDPGTSHAAAASIDPSTLMLMIWQVVDSFGERGCIADEIEDALPDVRIWSLSPRYRPMIDRGMLRYTGETRTGKSGRQQLVRVACQRPFQPVLALESPRDTSARLRLKELESILRDVKKVKQRELYGSVFILASDLAIALRLEPLEFVMGGDEHGE